MGPVQSQMSLQEGNIRVREDVTTKVDVRVMLPQTKECRQILEAGKGKQLTLP